MGDEGGILCLKNKKFCLLTSENTHERALGHIIFAADAPSLVLCHEELQPQLQTVLNQPVAAHSRITPAQRVTLVHPTEMEGKHFNQLSVFFEVRKL